MKIYLTIIAVFICSFSFSQDYLSAGTEWVEYKVGCGGGGLGITCISEKYTISLVGDTTINNIVYHKTRRKGIKTTWDDIADTIISEILIDDYLYPLREDQQKFYIYDADLGEDQLLHDFDLALGDQAVSSDNCQNLQTISEIEPLTFGSQVRNKFSIFSTSTIGMSSLYEGIGSTEGLFVRPCVGMTAIEGGSKLLCYTTNNETIVFDSISTCETTLPVSTEQLVIPENSIYPNPFDDKIIIENSFSNFSDLEINLFDYQGRLIKSIANIGNDELIEIATNELNAGIYVLLIRSKNKVHSTKMIKI